MAVARIYTVDTNLTTGISLGTGGVSGTEYVLMYGATSGEFNIAAVRIGLYSLASAAYPANGSIVFRLRPVSSTSSGILVGTGTAEPTGQSSTAALSTWIYSTANGSGIGTFATMTTSPKWSSPPIPLTAGANWGEWVTPGYEVNTTNATLALTYTMSNGTVSGVNVIPELVISE